jgi:hypothetical protein
MLVSIWIKIRKIGRFIGDEMGEYMTQSLKRGDTQKANKKSPNRKPQ